MRDSLQFRKIYWKLLLMIPCIVSAGAVTIRPLIFSGSEPAKWRSIAGLICQCSWSLSPVFPVYVVVVAFVFYYRKDFGGSSISFVAFGLLLQHAVLVARWWMGGNEIAI